MTDLRAGKPKLSTVLGVVVGVMLAAVGAILVVVLQNVDATFPNRIGSGYSYRLSGRTK
jgi:hypothetical protein